MKSLCKPGRVTAQLLIWLSQARVFLDQRLRRFEVLESATSIKYRDQFHR